MNRKIFLSLFCFIIALYCLIEMAESADARESSSSSPAVHIIYTEKPQDEQPEAYHLRTLASVLGSEEAAKDALIYSYKTAASGFSAKLTPEQVSEISKQPGVLQVVPSRTLQLHSGPRNLH
ncbi:calcium-dependent protein kinase 11-like isoform X1 [Hibiscus syriacus]|uniref:Calcium-dependent protein kinase 11-like isoform X1 n=1 Tax=Hibiscus syriacus TaxID=106335 RepID=A0A6A3AR55_HIBSY|nr:subtilisin-like protease SBT3.17 [Hibiscus syriacus]KAE8706388.1 calcium-dependent protein kinase 11-like isoform X1 [Hibiscus syriacus]